MNAHLQQLISNVQLENKTHEERFSNVSKQNLKQLKAEGLLIQPIRITRKSYGYADYPEVTFQTIYPTETSQFKSGCAIHLIFENEEPVKGMLLYLEGNKGEFRLFAPDFPDWLESKNVGIQLTPDQRTNEIMLQSLKRINENLGLEKRFNEIHTKQSILPLEQKEINLSFSNSGLNTSQQIAIQNCLSEASVQVIHGPPGTGKTTTLVELISQLTKQHKRILVSAPSNAAIDHLGTQLAAQQVDFIRVGNNTKVKESLLPYTIEGKMEETKLKSTIKNLRIRSEQLRKMANQYKRNFGKSERDQRKLLMNEVKAIRKEIRDLQDAFETSILEKQQVIIGTPIALHDNRFSENEFDLLIIDEAGQCLEPLAWAIIPLAKRLVVAGDPFQLPPTVISFDAAKNGLNKSILEQIITNNHRTYLLDTQYRMTSTIAEYSNRYFYEGKLKTANATIEHSISIQFYDTAGADYTESFNEDSFSIYNSRELSFIHKLLDAEQLNPEKTAFITPYSGQIQLSKEEFASIPFSRISTIDSFQGQEEETVIISLVRSNAEQQIGFLTDYRRMNVAMTRAKKSLYIIGDSSTIGIDPFYNGLLEFIEQIGGYHSVFEVDY